MSTIKVDKLQGTSGSTTGLTFSGANGTFGGTLAVTGAVTASDDMNFNSGYGSAATAYGCRAWVNFNGTGTVAITGSGNVSSITDNGTGNYTVNFTTAMTDVNYAAVGMNGSWAQNSATKATGSCGIQSFNSTTGALLDTATLDVAIFR